MINMHLLLPVPGGPWRSHPRRYGIPTSVYQFSNSKNSRQFDNNASIVPSGRTIESRGLRFLRLTVVQIDGPPNISWEFDSIRVGHAEQTDRRMRDTNRVHGVNDDVWFAHLDIALSSFFQKFVQNTHVKGINPI